jgi:hypothetical protein
MKRKQEQKAAIVTCMSEVQRVRLSRKSCMMSVLSLYDSSPRVSSSAMASSKAFATQAANQQNGSQQGK